MQKISYLIIFACCHLVIIAKAQTSSHIQNKINITAHSSSIKGKGNFSISITESVDSIKALYTFTDSLNYNLLEKDKRYYFLLPYFTRPDDTLNTTDSIRAYNKEFYQLLEKYTSYSADNIEVSIRAESAYKKLLDEVYITDIKVLENTDANKNIITLDGTFFFFEIKYNGNERTAGVISPTQKSYPILFDLIERTLNLYRKTKHNQFLNSKKTDGY